MLVELERIHGQISRKRPKGDLSVLICEQVHHRMQRSGGRTGERQDILLKKEPVGELVTEVGADLLVVHEELVATALDAGRQQGDASEGLNTVGEGDVGNTALLVLSREHDVVAFSGAVPARVEEALKSANDKTLADLVLLRMQHHEAEVATADMVRLDEVFDDDLAAVGRDSVERGGHGERRGGGLELALETRVGVKGLEELLEAGLVRVHVETTEIIETALEEDGNLLFSEFAVEKLFCDGDAEDVLTHVTSGRADDTAVIATVDTGETAVDHEGSHLDPLKGITAADVVSDLLEGHLTLTSTVGGADDGRGASNGDATLLQDSRVTTSAETHELPSTHATSDDSSIVTTSLLQSADNLARVSIVAANDSNQAILREGLDDLVDVSSGEPVHARNVANRASELTFKTNVNKVDSMTKLGNKVGRDGEFVSNEVGDPVQTKTVLRVVGFREKLGQFIVFLSVGK